MRVAFAAQWVSSRRPLPGPSHTHRYALGGLLLLWAGLFFPAAPLSAQTVTLNLKDADIRALVSTVADVTGRNFIVDPRVKGKVTVISGTPIQQKELYQLFLSVLAVHGFATVPAGEAIKIVPAASGKSDSTPVASEAAPGEGDELVTRVVRVANVPAARLVPILRPLVPQTGHLAAYPGSNVLIISDSAANVARLVSIIARIDVTGEAEVELIPLQHASAQEVVRILTTLLPPERKVEPAEAPTRFVADERTNSILLSGDKDARLRLRAIISDLDTPTEIQGNTHVIYLRYAKAKDLVPILEGVTRGATGGKERPAAPSGAAGGEISIQADESMNALVITAPTDTLASLKSVIRQLDIRRAQVLLEGIVAEVREDKARELGVQWRLTNNPTGTGAIGGTAFSVGGTSIQEVAKDPTTVGAGLALGYIEGKVSILGSDEILNIGALVQALASDTGSNILATPTVVTLDNEEAEFVVARNLPFVTGTFTSTGAGQGVTNPFQTVERQDVGLVLRVKPQINEGNTVKLEIEQEVSDVLPQAQAQLVGAVDVVTNKRSIKTSVLVEDNSMLVLSGLLEDRLTESEQKVPGLGDIPLLGYLFRGQETSKEKRNLMFFLRPHILRDVVSAGAATSRKYSYLRAQQLDAYRRGVNLMPNSEAPLLLELQDYLDAPPGTPAIGKASPKELGRARPSPAAPPGSK